MLTTILFTLLSGTAHASQGGYSTELGKQVGSCIQSKMLSAPATQVSDLKPGQSWACVTLNYFWDDANHVTYFLENFAPVHYRFDSVNGYPRNVVDAIPVEYSVFAYPELSGVREDLRVGLEHTVDFIVARDGFLFVERSLSNSPYNLNARPSLAESPLALLDQAAAREYEARTGESHSTLYRRAVEYRACFPANKPELKSQVPCFGNLDNAVLSGSY